MLDDLNQWRPVCRSSDVRRPLGTRVAATDVVVFRTASGRVAALQGQCPHRRMKLSAGRVRGEAIECAYHGWTFSAAGAGAHSVSTDERMCAVAYETRECFGLVWIKAVRSAAEFPPLLPQGYHHIYTLFGTVPVPVELLLDNFTEVEHTAKVHWIFGYPQERLREVEFHTAVEGNTVRCISRGPQKRLPIGADRVFGIRPDDRFILEWTTEGPPLRTTYNMWWEEPGSGAARAARLFAIAYFLDRGAGESTVAALYFGTAPLLFVPGVGSAVRWVWARNIELEYRRDSRLLEALAGAAPGLQGLRLGRFDRGLAAQRKLFFQTPEGEN